MADVTSRLKALLSEKDQAVTAQVRRMLAILKEVRDQVAIDLIGIPGKSYTAAHLKQNLASIERAIAAFQAAAGAQLTGGISELWHAGVHLLEEAATGTGTYVGFAFGAVAPDVLEGLQSFGQHLVGKLSADALGKIRGELTLGVLGQKTPQEVANAVAGSLTASGAGAGVWSSIEERAEVITRTELGRAYSAANQARMEKAVAVLPDLKKQWWHAGHPRMPRASHLALHGQVVAAQKPFVVGSVVLLFPRDPKAPIQETIRCGCEALPWHPSWSKAPPKLPLFDERGRVRRSSAQEALQAAAARTGSIARPTAREGL